MAHEAHHDTHHQPEDKTPTTSFRSSVWLVIILAGLFVAAVNFINVMGHDDAEGHGGGHGTETHRVEPMSTHQPGEQIQHAGTKTVEGDAQHNTELPATTSDSTHAGHH